MCLAGVISRLHNSGVDSTIKRSQVRGHPQLSVLAFFNPPPYPPSQSIMLVSIVTAVFALIAASQSALAVPTSTPNPSAPPHPVTALDTANTDQLSANATTPQPDIVATLFMYAGPNCSGTGTFANLGGIPANACLGANVFTSAMISQTVIFGPAAQVLLGPQGCGAGSVLLSQPNRSPSAMRRKCSEGNLNFRRTRPHTIPNEVVVNENNNARWGAYHNARSDATAFRVIVPHWQSCASSTTQLPSSPSPM
ncbi:hypothetical protein C8Q78DRAFT_424825 [Trametes maxima]|nr:hypothetical protein C8Q78DRAFT_424825 [Trametes maxima]